MYPLNMLQVGSPPPDHEYALGTQSPVRDIYIEVDIKIISLDTSICKNSYDISSTAGSIFSKYCTINMCLVGP